MSGNCRGAQLKMKKFQKFVCLALRIFRMLICAQTTKRGQHCSGGKCVQSTVEDVVADIERRAAKLRLSISEISRRARLARSTFQRWKSGVGEPSFSALRRIYEVLEAEERAL